MSEVEGSPQGKAAQMAALSTLGGEADANGLTAPDQATMEQAASRTGADDRGRREAILMNRRERGVGGEGDELVASMMGAQDAATNENQAGLDIAGQARQRAIQAASESGQLGSQVDQQRFGQEADRARAQDEINKFNAANRTSVETANVAAQNEAAARNQAEKQRISDSNAAIAGDQAKTNATATQTAFQDQAQKAGGIASADQNLASGKTAAETSKRAFEGGLVSTAGNVGAGYLAGKNKPTYLLSDENAKKDVADAPAADLEEFMSSLDPKTFEYKKPDAPGASPGKNVGVLAQDLEKSKLGKDVVTETAGGKAIDVKKALGVLLAAIAELHENQEKGAANV